MPMPVKFLKSAVFVADYPDGKRPEIAISGRSNAGKSTFINTLTGSRIAKVSQEPGKTRLLNFFDVGDHYRLVDTPGYGFASRSGQEIQDWQNMIETYFSVRENLSGLLLLMDIRRNWSDDEAGLVDMMNGLGKSTMIVLTKSDRLKRDEIEKRVKELRQESGIFEIWPTSSEKKIGIKEVENHFFTNWIKPNLRGS